MKVQYLVSTMDQIDTSIVKRMNIQSDVIVVNQNNNIEGLVEYEENGIKVKMISVIDRGLSKSRNLVLDNAYADYCMFSDDDVIYYDNAHKIIRKYHEKYPDYAVIAFNIKYFKDNLIQKKKILRLGWLSSMKLSSPQLSIKLEPIKKTNIRFKTEFGAGAKYICGEENILLYDCMRAGMKILYVPVTIGKVNGRESTWFRGFDKTFFITKGANFEALSKRFSLLFILQFAIRKYKKYRKETSFKNAMRYMLSGRREYMESLKNRRRKG